MTEVGEFAQFSRVACAGVFGAMCALLFGVAGSARAASGSWLGLHAGVRLNHSLNTKEDRDGR